MKSLDRLAALVDPSAEDAWYVTDGATAVGPVTLELLARGITAGKVPPSAFVKHESWSAWRDLKNLDELDPSFDPRRSFQVLPAVKAAGDKPSDGKPTDAKPAPERAHKSPPRKVPPPPKPIIRETLPSIDLVEDVEQDGELGALDEDELDSAASLFEGALDVPEGLLMLLSTVVQRCEAEAALVHRALGTGAIVACSHGPKMFQMLGEAMPTGDPVLYAAKQGQTIFAEPVSGVGGRAIKKRLSRLGAHAEAAFMVPVHLDGRLLALVEAGRSRPFRASDVANVEDLVDTFVEIVEASNWGREWRAAAPPPEPLDEPPPESAGG